VIEPSAVCCAQQQDVTNVVNKRGDSSRDSRRDRLPVYSLQAAAGDRLLELNMFNHEQLSRRLSPTFNREIMIQPTALRSGSACGFFSVLVSSALYFYKVYAFP